MGIGIAGVTGFPEVRRGDDLAALIRERVALDDTIIVVVAQKIVSKAEGAEVALADVEPSELARKWAAQWQKDPRVVEVAGRMVQLYKEITAKALENEKAKK